MPAAMFRPTMPAAKAKAGPHMATLAAAGMSFVVLVVSMPVHQKSSLLDITGPAHYERSSMYRK
jgi:hypothetical protein